MGNNFYEDFFSACINFAAQEVPRLFIECSVIQSSTDICCSLVMLFSFKLCIYVLVL